MNEAQQRGDELIRREAGPMSVQPIRSIVVSPAAPPIPTKARNPPS